MTNSVYIIISSEKKTSYKNKVSIYVFKHPGKIIPLQKVTKFLVGDENFYRPNILPTILFAAGAFTGKVYVSPKYPIAENY